MVKSPEPEQFGIRSILANLRRNFLAGLVIIAPIGLTIYIVWTAVGVIDSWILPLIPERYHPSRYFLVDVRGIGLVIFIVFTLLVGYTMRGLIGRTILGWAEGIVDRTPIVRNVYNSIKQISETVVNQSSSSFEKACLIEYPRKGIWAIGFLSRPSKGAVQNQYNGNEQLIGIFLPTTPNPTSGFLLFVPKSDLIILDMTIEDAIKLVISAGLVYPPDGQNETNLLPDTTKHRAESQSNLRK